MDPPSSDEYMSGLVTNFYERVTDINDKKRGFGKVDQWQIFPDIYDPSQPVISFLCDESSFSKSAGALEKFVLPCRVKFKVKHNQIQAGSLSVLSETQYYNMLSGAPEEARSASDEKFSENQKLGSSVVTCQEPLKTWVCPWELKENPLLVCNYENPFWVDSSVESISRISTKVCHSCRKPKPESTYYENRSIERTPGLDQTNFILKPLEIRPKLQTLEDIKKFNEENFGKHTVPAEIIEKAEKDFDKALELAQLKCPGCNAYRGSSETGCCGHVRGLHPSKFSQWYKLEGEYNP